MSHRFRLPLFEANNGAQAMKDLFQVEGKLIIVKRMPSSRNGNARFMCLVGETVFTTLPDSSLASDVKNLEGKEVIVVVGTHRGLLQLDSIERAS
jgi:predicted dithiol-disulfide oxidoreductase (DUF899 family)